MRLGWRHDQRRPGREREEELPHRHVECGGRFLEQTVGRREEIELPHPLESIDDGAMFDDRALGRACRAGRENDVRGVVDPCVVDRRVRHIVRIERLQIECRDVRRQIGHRSLREHEDRTGAVDHLRDAGGRVGRINWKIGCGGAEDAHECEHELERSRRHDGDHVPAVDAAMDELSRERGRAPIELAIAPRHALEFQRRRIRRRMHAIDDEPRQRDVRHVVRRGVDVHRPSSRLGGVHRRDVGQRGRVGRARNERCEPAGMGLELRLAVEPRIAVDVETQPGARPVRAPGDREIVDRARGEHVQRGVESRPRECVVERQDVDQRAVKAAMRTRQAQIAAQLLTAVASMAAQPLKMARRRRQPDTHLGIFIDGDPRGQDVHDHGRHARGRTPQPFHRRDADDGLAATGVPLDVRGRQGDDDVRPHDAARRGHRHDRGIDAGRKVTDAGEIGVRGQIGTRRETDGLRTVGELFVPELAIGCELRRRQIRGFVVDDVGDWRERRGFRLRAGHGGAVEVAHTPHDQRRAVSVDGDVMNAQIPARPVVVDLEQDRGRERVAFERHGRRHVAPHQCQRLAVGIGHVAQIDLLQRGTRQWIEDPAWPVVTIDHAEAERVGLFDGLGDGLSERLDVERPTQVDVLPGVEDGIGGIDALRVPQTELGLRERRHVTRRDRCDAHREVTSPRSSRSQ